MPAHARLTQAVRELPAPVRWLAAPFGLLACILLLVNTWTDPQRVTVPKPDPAALHACQALRGELPLELQGHGREEVQPYSQLTMAWHTSPRTVLRCGVDEPELLLKHPESDSIGVNGVNWLIEKRANGDVLFTTIERRANVEVLVPAGAFPNPTDALPQLSDAVGRTVPSRFTQ